MLRRLISEVDPRGWSYLAARGMRFASREDALSQAGDVRVHYKGGVYRKIATLMLRRDAAAGTQLIVHGKTPQPVMVLVTDDATQGTSMALYEHLYPGGQRFYLRPDAMFEERLNNGEPRFAKAKAVP